MISSVGFNGERTAQMDRLRFKFVVLAGMVDVAEKYPTRDDLAPEKKLAPRKRSDKATTNFNFILLDELIDGCTFEAIFIKRRLFCFLLFGIFRQAKGTVTNVASFPIGRMYNTESSTPL